VNDLGGRKTMAHLPAFDSLLGPLDEEVRTDRETISVGERRLRALSSSEPADLPWRELVVESTGRFERRDKAQAHLDAGARMVVITAVANDADVTIALGVNDNAYDPLGDDLLALGQALGAPEVRLAFAMLFRRRLRDQRGNPAGRPCSSIATIVR
jgi:glyceraldehyde 3-phosphate dehydrogenase